MPKLLAKNQARILASLARQDGEMAGTRTVEMLSGDMGRSSVFAALAALHRDGMVDSRWEIAGERPYRVYAITERGREALAAFRSAFA